MGLIVNLDGILIYDLIEDVLCMFVNMEYCGVCGCELNFGDGVGIFIQLFYDFLVDKCCENGFELFIFGEYGVGMVFFLVD